MKLSYIEQFFTKVKPMQISRHWRLNATRYRLEGIQYEDGSVSLQKRPQTEQTSLQSEDDTQPAISQNEPRKTGTHVAA
jgi:hypothetical protein